MQMKMPRHQPNFEPRSIQLFVLYICIVALEVELYAIPRVLRHHLALTSLGLQASK